MKNPMLLSALLLAALPAFSEVYTWTGGANGFAWIWAGAPIAASDYVGAGSIVLTVPPMETLFFIR